MEYGITQILLESIERENDTSLLKELVELVPRSGTKYAHLKIALMNAACLVLQKKLPENWESLLQKLMLGLLRRPPLTEEGQLTTSKKEIASEVARHIRYLHSGKFHPHSSLLKDIAFGTRYKAAKAFVSTLRDLHVSCLSQRFQLIAVRHEFM